ncbi:uncharacterized protein A1O5_11726 [Cladophialophora psammophila CBS 110553]|uniref:2,4-dienoyl-CoA reductase [(3E)-enoyl-CoA-producing] n=1 Tax=Cladophialophora psammophila CBS 110553 TaxID=1182543 RepID=W9WA59_9EURO|nr:uncharacterized protein A1O5_11726 [Cladophialophora psammophila CBS 110553]EXJ61411.1 hypothetical protein A1O5_11726 [Cladophialophora psammophila CBS 110553]
MNSENYISKIWQRGIFENRVVFCTGGSGDICSSQVRALVYLGANACIVGRNKQKAERVAADIANARPGANVLGIGNVDVRKIEALEAAVSKCVSTLGGIDFVIAGAAGNFLAPFVQLSTNAFKSVIDIDLMGSWNTVKTTVPHLLDSVAKYPGAGDYEGGRIIFISATLQYTGVPLNTHGVVAKAGVDALSAQLAIELGPRGVTSNVIAPGMIQSTEGERRLFRNSGIDMVRRVPTGRLGTIKDVNNATVFLLAETGDYVNGTVQVVDGAAWRIGAQVTTGVEYPASVLVEPKILKL